MRLRAEEINGRAARRAVQLEAVVAHMAEGLMVVEAGGAITVMNAAAQELYGYAGGRAQPGDLAAFAQRHLLHDLQGRPLPADAWPTARALRGETFSGYELQVQNLDAGRTWTGSYSGTPVRDREGGLAFTVITLRDVTECKRVEAALQEAEAALRRQHTEMELERRRLQAMLDVMPVGVFIADAGGRLVQANQAARALWGGEVPLVSMHEFDRFRGWWADTGRQLQAHDWGMARALREGEVVAGEEIHIECFDGSRKTILNYALPIRDVQDRIVGGVAVTVDVSRLKQAERDLKQLNETLEQRVGERTAALERKTQEVRLLASALTLAEQQERRRISQILHDHLQQMLYGLQLKTQVLRLDLQGQSDHTAQIAQISQIITDAIRMARTLSVDLSPPVLHGEGLEAALHWLAVQMQEAYSLHVEVGTRGTPQTPAHDMRILLFQLVRELLFNVVKHAGVDRARVWVTGAAGELIIEVEDEGIGFDLAAVGRRGDRAAGFGLASVRERLDLLGGHLEITTSPGAGTCVTIRAPTEVGTSQRLSREQP